MFNVKIEDQRLERLARIADLLGLIDVYQNDTISKEILEKVIDKLLSEFELEYFALDYGKIHK